MQPLPSLSGLNWARIRTLADQLAKSEAGEMLAQAAEDNLSAFEGTERMLAVYLLGFTSGAHPERLEVLRQRVPADPSWEVQEALAQAFDAYCAAIGYEQALPMIDAWLARSEG